MVDVRVGDTIDDYCSRCRLVTDHSVVALLDTAVRKVRCRTCHYEHDYRQGKGSAKKTRASAFDQVLASIRHLPGVTAPEEKPQRARRKS